MYIGTRQQESIRYLAATGQISPEEAESKYGVPKGDVEYLKIELEKKPEDRYYSPDSGSSNVEAKYVSSKGTVVYGVKGSSVTLPVGSRAVTTKPTIIGASREAYQKADERAKAGMTVGEYSERERMAAKKPTVAFSEKAYKTVVEPKLGEINLFREREAATTALGREAGTFQRTGYKIEGFEGGAVKLTRGKEQTLVAGEVVAKGPLSAKFQPRFIKFKEKAISIRPLKEKGFFQRQMDKLNKTMQEGYVFYTGLYPGKEFKQPLKFPGTKDLIPEQKKDDAVSFYRVILPKEKALKAEEFTGAVGRSALTYLREKPANVVLTTAAFTGLGYGIAATGAGLALKGVKVWGITQAGFAIGLPAIYGTRKYKQIKAAPSLEAKGTVVGETLVGEIAPAVAGSLAGQKLFKITQGWWRTRKQTFKEPGEITEYDVLTGQKTFPSASSGQAQISKFYKQEFALPQAQRYTGSRYGQGVWKDVRTSELPFKTFRPPKGVFQAADVPFRKDVILGYGAKRPTDLPGLYTAPSVSQYFLRLGGQQPKIYSYKFLSGNLPTVTYINVKGFGVLKGTFSQQTSFLAKGAPKGFAYISALPGETEALIPPSTGLQFTQSRFFTIYKGVRVPILEYKATGFGEIGKTANFLTAGTMPAYYSYPRSSFLSTDVFLGLSTIPSRKSTSYSKITTSATAYSYRPRRFEYKPYTPRTERYSIARYSTSYIPYTSYSSTTYKPSSVASSISRAISYTPTPIRSYTPPIRKITIPKPGIPKIPKVRQRKIIPKFKLKKLKRKTKYQPSLVAAQLKTYGRKPKILTGLEVRPLPKIKI